MHWQHRWMKLIMRFSLGFLSFLLIANFLFCQLGLHNKVTVHMFRWDLTWRRQSLKNKQRRHLRNGGKEPERRENKRRKVVKLHLDTSVERSPPSKGHLPSICSTRISRIQSRWKACRILQDHTNLITCLRWRALQWSLAMSKNQLPRDRDG